MRRLIAAMVLMVGIVGSAQAALYRFQTLTFECSDGAAECGGFLPTHLNQMAVSGPGSLSFYTWAYGADEPDVEMVNESTVSGFTYLSFDSVHLPLDISVPMCRFGPECFADGSFSLSPSGLLAGYFSFDTMSVRLM